jgi:hypothetical protein
MAKFSYKYRPLGELDPTPAWARDKLRDPRYFNCSVLPIARFHHLKIEHMEQRATETSAMSDEDLEELAKAANLLCPLLGLIYRNDIGGEESFANLRYLIDTSACVNWKKYPLRKLTFEGDAKSRVATLFDADKTRIGQWFLRPDCDLDDQRLLRHLMVGETPGEPKHEAIVTKKEPHLTR